MFCAVLSSPLTVTDASSDSHRQNSMLRVCMCVVSRCIHRKGEGFIAVLFQLDNCLRDDIITPLVTSSGHRCVSSQAATLVCCEIISGNCFIDPIVIGTTLRTIFDPKIGGSIGQSNAEALKANVAATL